MSKNLVAVFDLDEDFIDDNESNIHSARAFGMTAIHFTSPEALRSDLIKLGFPLIKAD